MRYDALQWTPVYGISTVFSEDNARFVTHLSNTEPEIPPHQDSNSTTFLEAKPSPLLTWKVSITELKIPALHEHSLAVQFVSTA